MRLLRFLKESETETHKEHSGSNGVVGWSLHLGEGRVN